MTFIPTFLGDPNGVIFPDEGASLTLTSKNIALNLMKKHVINHGKKKVFAGGVNEQGEIDGHKALVEAYSMGNAI